MSGIRGNRVIVAVMLMSGEIDVSDGCGVEVKSKS